MKAEVTWIACSDAMPPEGDEVLFVTRREGHPEVEYGSCSKFGWSVAYDRYEGDHWELDQVSHWAELPEPPR